MNHHKTVASPLPSVIKVEFSELIYAEHCVLATSMTPDLQSVHSFPSFQLILPHFKTVSMSINWTLLFFLTSYKFSYISIGIHVI